MDLYQLIYISRATKPFNHEELEELVGRASNNNKHKEITGNLIYNSGVFMQLLEGDKETISNLYEHICEDERHTKVKQIYFESCNYRLFSKWSMRLIDLEVEHNKNLSRIRELLISIDESGKVGNMAAPVVILKEFANLV